MDPAGNGERRSTVLRRIRYMHGTEQRERCFAIVDGEPEPTPCVEAVGLGDIVAGATKAVGVNPCGGCKKRQAALNRATPSWLKRALAWLRSVSLP